MPFGFSSTAAEVVKGHNLNGYEVIVTGGASGIGVETVRQLAKAGARVVIANRNLENAEEVAKELRKETGKDHIEAMKLDLSSLASVNEFSKAYLAKNRPLNILINNAGIMNCPKATTVDGLELQFGTCHIGHFALTLALLPALKAAAAKTGKKSRVVSLASSGHQFGDVLYDDYNFEKKPYDGWTAYGQAKTANILFAVGLTKRYASEGVVANALHPGGIATKLQRHMKQEDMAKLVKVMVEDAKEPLVWKTIEQGAATTVWAAVADELEGKGGLYLEDCSIGQPMAKKDVEAIERKVAAMTSGKEVPKESESIDTKGYMPRVLDPVRADKLWDLSLKIIKK